MALPLLCVGMVAAFALGLGALGEPAPAFAQTPGTAGPISLGELFTDPDSVNLKPGAAEKLLEAAGGAINPREPCPQQANFKVIVKSGDRLFQRSLAEARGAVLIDALKNQNFPDSRYEFTYDWQGSANDVRVEYGRMRDRQPPNLHTTSVPPKGTKVKAGDRITITMVARDDTNRVQSGIHRIQLVARTPGGDEPVGSQDYPLVRRPNCEGMPEARTLVLTYTVPRNPPPVVRLVAVTEDHVGLSDHDHGEFPTEGDWYGTFKFEGVSLAAVRSRASADIVLNQDGQGNLRGTMSGQHQIPAATSPNGCSWQPGQPNRFRVSLVGSYTEGRSFKVFIDEVVEDTGIRYMLTCSGIPIPMTLERAFSYAWGYKAFLGTPSPLGEGEVAADGTRQYKFGSEAGPEPAWTVTLRPARN